MKKYLMQKYEEVPIEVALNGEIEYKGILKKEITFKKRPIKESRWLRWLG